MIFGEVNAIQNHGNNGAGQENSNSGTCSNYNTLNNYTNYYINHQYPDNGSNELNSRNRANNSSYSRSNRGRSDFITKFNINLGSREVINHQR